MYEYQDILNDIETDLSSNYKNDKEVLKDILNDTISNALFISNRKKTTDNINLLLPEIKKAVKSIYLQRGGEGTKGISEMGISSTFENPLEILRADIIKNGKRRII